jgi:hypothetical protein
MAESRNFTLAIAGTLLLLPASSVRPASTDVVLNEILYNADPSNPGGEFVELFNRGAAAVDLSGFSLAGGVSFTLGGCDAPACP